MGEEVHPGRILKLELEARGLKQRIAPQCIQEIVAGWRAISPEFWLAIQASHDLAMLRASVGRRIEAEVEVAA